MNTLSQTPKNAVPFEMCDSYNKAFEAAEDVVVGQLVKLTSTGTVEKVTAATDVPLGIVIKAALTGNKTTVSTNFRAVVRGGANGTINAGETVNWSASPSDLTVYIAAGEGVYVTGMALETIADEAIGEIGLFYTPIFIPAP